MSRLFGPTLIALTLVTALPGIARAAEIATFRVGIAAPTVNMLPLWTAEQSGLFKAHGLNVEIVNTEGGSRGLAEVGAGKLQAMIVGLSAVIDANGKGGNYRLIASGANTLSFRFFWRKGNRSCAGVEGRKSRRKHVRIRIRQCGDHGTKAVGPCPRRCTAGGSRRNAQTAGGAKVRENFGDRIERARGYRSQTRWFAAACRPESRSAVDFHGCGHGQRLPRRLTGNRRGSFCRPISRESTSRCPIRSRAKAVLTGEFRDFSREALDATYDDFRARVPRDAEPSRAGAELMLRELPVFGGGKQRRVEDFIDTSVLDELRRSGFFDDLKRRYRVP